MNELPQRIPVFVISLARAPERRRAVCRHLDELRVGYEVVDAIDGRALAPSEIDRLVAPGKAMHPGAVGCYLSHIRVYERMQESATDVALVLEDDARLNPRIPALLRGGCRKVDWDYCFLDCDDHNDRGPVFYDTDSGRPIGAGFRAYDLSAGPQTTHAYLITRLAAEKRLRHAFPMHCPIDLYDHLPYAIRFASMIRPKGAWVSEHSLQSFTSKKKVDIESLSLLALRRWPLFYRMRDLLRMKDFRRNRLAKQLQAQGKLPPARHWKALPSGREVLIA